MDWRKPEAWPQAVQRGSFVLAFVLGFVALSPVWLSAWQDWRVADMAVQEMQALVEDTQSLHQQTVKVQANAGRQALAFKGASEISHLAHLNMLKPSAVAMGRATPSAAMDALQFSNGRYICTLWARGSHGWDGSGNGPPPCQG